MIDTQELDKARLEWQFEVLQKEHGLCCTGALLWHPMEGQPPQWVNVLHPVDSPHYRAWDET